MSMNLVESNTIKVNAVIAVRLYSIFNNSHRLYPTQLGILCPTPINDVDNRKAWMSSNVKIMNKGELKAFEMVRIQNNTLEK